MREQTSPPAPLPRERGGADLPPSPPRRGAGGEAFSRGAGMTDRARDLRTNMTDAERKLWSALRGDQLGVRFRRQLVIDRRYIVDFCAPQIGLIIEVDGQHHITSLSDPVRTAYLEARDYTVLRFWNNAVLNETEAVIDATHRLVTDLLAARPSPPTPLRDGEGRRLLPKDSA